MNTSNTSPPFNTSEHSSYTVAVAGNPNAGKSTLINAIAGSRLQVGNWPGVTVEKKEASLNIDNVDIKLIDLPGTYSLSPYTEEEIVARDFLIKNKPDVIINVIDTTNLERNLFLTVQLLELGIPIIIALNMFDEVESKGYKIDVKAIEKILGVKVVPTTAIKKQGLDELMKAVLSVLDKPEEYTPRELVYSKDIEAAIRILADKIEKTDPTLFETYPKKWLLYKIIERDISLFTQIQLDPDKFLDNEAVRHLENAHDKDIETFMSDARYAQTSGLTKEVMTKPLVPKLELTEKIDKIVLSRFLGIPIFLLIMWLIFKLTFDVSAPFSGWIDYLTTGPLSRWSTHLLTAIGASDWLISLVTEGIIGGVGFVLVFVPVISAMMFFITFLEGCGYMARAAFVMDRYMHLIGLHGKSFIPMIMGFGCNVPGIYATRTLENPKDRFLTALLIPLMSCSARLPVYILLIGAFFPGNSGSILFSIYILGIVLAILVGRIFRKTLFRGETPVFIMELPPYRIPSLNNLLIHTWEKVKHFIIKAGTFILAMSIFIWFALNLPWGVENKKDSYLGETAQIITPVFEPLGFGTWEISSALLTGIIAKEMVVSTLGEIYAVSFVEKPDEKVPTFIEDVVEIVKSFFIATKDAALNAVSIYGISSISMEEGKDSRGLRLKIQQQLTPLGAYSLMVFVLLYMPCFITGIAMKHEFGSWNLFIISTIYGITLAWIASFIIFQGGNLIGLGA